jgi:hypothetical protein
MCRHLKELQAGRARQGRRWTDAAAFDGVAEGNIDGVRSGRGAKDNND